MLRRKRTIYHQHNERNLSIVKYIPWLANIGLWLGIIFVILFINPDLPGAILFFLTLIWITISTTSFLILKKYVLSVLISSSLVFILILQYLNISNLLNLLLLISLFIVFYVYFYRLSE